MNLNCIYIMYWFYYLEIIHKYCPHFDILRTILNKLEVYIFYILLTQEYDNCNYFIRFQCFIILFIIIISSILFINIVIVISYIWNDYLFYFSIFMNIIIIFIMFLPLTIFPFISLINIYFLSICNKKFCIFHFWLDISL